MLCPSKFDIPNKIAHHILGFVYAVLGGVFFWRSLPTFDEVCGETKA